MANISPHLPVVLPCVGFRLHLEVDAVEQMGRLAVALLWCARDSHSLDDLAHMTCLPKELLREEAEFLSSAGLLTKNGDSLNLTQIGKEKLLLYQKVQEFNTEKHQVFVELVSGNTTHEVKGELGENLIKIPALQTTRFLQRQLIRSEKTKQFAIDAGVPRDWLYDDSSDASIERGDAVIHLRKIGHQQLWTTASLDVSNLSEAIERAYEEVPKARSVVIGCKASRLLPPDKKVPIGLWVEHVTGSLIRISEDALNDSSRKDLALPSQMDDEQVTNILKQFWLERNRESISFDLNDFSVETVELGFPVPTKEFVGWLRLRAN